MTTTASFGIGTELSGRPRVMTRERMRWYVDAQPTVALDSGRIERQQPTIHDDDEYAKSQGLPGIIADGMVSTNWIMGLLIDNFGDVVARRGSLRTKYVKPIYENDSITCRARITGLTHGAGSSATYRLDVWCDNQKGETVTAGDATVIVS